MKYPKDRYRKMTAFRAVEHPHKRYTSWDSVANKFPSSKEIQRGTVIGVINDNPECISRSEILDPHEVVPGMLEYNDIPWLEGHS